MKTNFKYSVLMAAISAFLFMPVAAQAQDIPDALHKNLTKKYKGQMKVPVDYQNGRYIRKPVGAYIMNDAFTDITASPLGRGTKRVQKYCEKEQSGVFTQIAKILPHYNLSVDPITFESHGNTVSYTAEEIFALNSSGSWPDWHQRIYLRLSNKGKLGVFACQDVNGSTLWSMSIIPNANYFTKSILGGEDVLYMKDIVLMPLDVKTMESIQASQKLVERVEEQKKNEKNQNRSDFESGLDIGSETNCGMVIGKRGPLFEVDLKPSAARRSGKSVAWLKVDKLREDGSCHL